MTHRLHRLHNRQSLVYSHVQDVVGVETETDVTIELPESDTELDQIMSSPVSTNEPEAERPAEPVPHLELETDSGAVVEIDSQILDQKPEVIQSKPEAEESKHIEIQESISEPKPEVTVEPKPDVVSDNEPQTKIEIDPKSEVIPEHEAGIGSEMTSNPNAESKSESDQQPLSSWSTWYKCNLL